MELFQFEFRSYHRPFRTPLMTAHGLWTAREGMIVRLSQASGRVGYGEIAPIAWFGAETFAQALEFCQQQPSTLSQEDVLSVPKALPACQFGLESAWESMQRSLVSLASGQTIPLSALLPTGEAALTAWKSLYQAGDRTFKWKIAVTEIQQELAWFHQLCNVLPEDCKLRLDANGGLTGATTATWLEACDRCSKVEYLEQPLPPESFQDLLKLQASYATAIALDESVANLHQLIDCYQKGWRGVFVIKPAISGSPSQLRQFLQANSVDAVFSSVFETAIGRQAGLALAAQFSHSDRAAGYGTNHWFFDDLQDANALWQSL